MCLFHVGLSIQLNFSHLENCTASRVSSLIYVNCEYSRDSLAIGFQAVVYNKEKIRVNQTADRQTSTTVEVEENGQYLVFVIPVLPETGITNTSLEYMSMILDQQGTYMCKMYPNIYMLVSISCVTLFCDCPMFVSLKLWGSFTMACMQLKHICLFNAFFCIFWQGGKVARNLWCTTHNIMMLFPVNTQA